VVLGNLQLLDDLLERSPPTQAGGRRRAPRRVVQTYCKLLVAQSSSAPKPVAVEGFRATDGTAGAHVDA
jgi:hypothetical protein